MSASLPIYECVRMYVFTQAFTGEKKEKFLLFITSTGRMVKGEIYNLAPINSRH